VNNFKQSFSDLNCNESIRCYDLLRNLKSFALRGGLYRETAMARCADGPHHETISVQLFLLLCACVCVCVCVCVRAGFLVSILFSKTPNYWAHFSFLVLFFKANRDLSY
jgi:hypothetical protein